MRAAWHPEKAAGSVRFSIWPERRGTQGQYYLARRLTQEGPTAEGRRVRPINKGVRSNNLSYLTIILLTQSKTLRL